MERFTAERTHEMSEEEIAESEILAAERYAEGVLQKFGVKEARKADPKANPHHLDSVFEISQDAQAAEVLELLNELERDVAIVHDCINELIENGTDFELHPDHKELLKRFLVAHRLAKRVREQSNGSGETK